MLPSNTTAGILSICETFLIFNYFPVSHPNPPPPPQKKQLDLNDLSLADTVKFGLNLKKNLSSVYLGAGSSFMVM